MRRANGTITAGVVVLSVLVTACDPKSEPPTGPSEERLFVTVTGTVTDPEDAPVAGVNVVVISPVVVAGTTDAAGQFTFEHVAYYQSQGLTISFAKSGYLTFGTKRSPAGPELSIQVRLGQIFTLPIDGAATSTLGPADPGGWIGDPYDSDYSSNTKYYRVATGGDDITVELDWDHTQDPDLRMWALDGTIVSHASADRQVLQLPRNSEGMLLVGRPYTAGPLTQRVSFTIETRKVSR
jgi:hypothetical protein